MDLAVLCWDVYSGLYVDIGDKSSLDNLFLHRGHITLFAQIEAEKQTKRIRQSSLLPNW